MKEVTDSINHNPLVTGEVPDWPSAKVGVTLNGPVR